MIRIIKGPAPSVLLTEGVACLPAHEAAIAGGASPDFLHSIYAHDSVKNALVAVQFGKCAFCESFFKHIAYGDIEHFRPKGGFRQSTENELEKPGYYWLAYDWGNLFCSCTLCNQ